MIRFSGSSILVSDCLFCLVLSPPYLVALVTFSFNTPRPYSVSYQIRLADLRLGWDEGTVNQVIFATLSTWSSQTLIPCPISEHWFIPMYLVVVSPCATDKPSDLRSLLWRRDFDACSTRFSSRRRFYLLESRPSNNMTSILYGHVIGYRCCPICITLDGDRHHHRLIGARSDDYAIAGISFACSTKRGFRLG